jgi:hypothetical protein
MIMKHLKMLGLAMTATLALMAFASGSAQATALCTSADTPACTNAHTYLADTAIGFSSTSGTSIAHTGGGNTFFACTGVSLKGKTTSTGSSGKAVNMTINSLTWSDCGQTMHTITNGSLSFKWINGTHSATVEGQGTQWTYVIFGSSCTYGFGNGTHLGTLTGSEQPILKIAATVMRVAGGTLCPASMGFDAELAVTEPHAVYFVDQSEEPGILCKSTTTPCTTAYGKETTLDADLNGPAVFESNGSTIATCSGGTLRAKTKNAGSNTEPVTADIEALSWSGCGQATSTVSKGSLEIERIEGSENATVLGKSTQITLGVAGTSCTYGFGDESDIGTLTGKEVPLIDLNTELPKIAGGFVCPVSVRLKAEYKLTEPAPLYVESPTKGSILCKSTATPCTNAYGKETTLDADLNGSTLFKTGSTTMATCTGATLKAKTKNAGSSTEAIIAAIEAFTWSGCSQTTTTLNNGSLKIERMEGTENATVLGKDTQFTFGIFGTSCTYGFGHRGTDLGTLVGGVEPTLSFSATVPRLIGGFLCPSTSTWTASYKITEPTPLYMEPN